jgi:hypothetical protein
MIYHLGQDKFHAEERRTQRDYLTDFTDAHRRSFHLCKSAQSVRTFFSVPSAPQREITFKRLCPGL